MLLTWSLSQHRHIDPSHCLDTALSPTLITTHGCADLHLPSSLAAWTAGWLQKHTLSASLFPAAGTALWMFCTFKKCHVETISRITSDFLQIVALVLAQLRVTYSVLEGNIHQRVDSILHLTSHYQTHFLHQPGARAGDCIWWRKCSPLCNNMFLRHTEIITFFLSALTRHKKAWHHRHILKQYCNILYSFPL